jgi:hypothetical protein
LKGLIIADWWMENMSSLRDQKQDVLMCIAKEKKDTTNI